MNRVDKIIGIQYNKYVDNRKEVRSETDWLIQYGLYLFKSSSSTESRVFYALIIGPEETLYHGGMLFVRISFDSDYPFSPPKIENLLSFPRQFNSNLWSSDVCQNLISSSGEYKPYYGLICMDILNTPHSKITTNAVSYTHLIIYTFSQK